jgi:hypothetical protein
VLWAPQKLRFSRELAVPLLVEAIMNLQQGRQLVEYFNSIEGMTNEVSAWTWLSLFKFQSANSIAGPMLEVGTYRGKTAYLMAESLNPQEHLFLIDCNEYLEHSHFERFKDRYSLWIGYSELMKDQMPGYKDLARSVRFFHSDASHTFANVVNDIGIADEILADEGILVIDDFQNFRYPQVQAATSYAIWVQGNDFKPFLVVDNKAYLCRPDMAKRYMEYVRDDMFSEINKDGSLILSRSDDDAMFSPFSISPRLPGETELWWGGEGLYKSCYTIE